MGGKREEPFLLSFVVNNLWKLLVTSFLTKALTTCQSICYSNSMRYIGLTMVLFTLNGCADVVFQCTPLATGAVQKGCSARAEVHFQPRNGW